MESVVIKQNRGRALRFKGTLLCSTEFETGGRDPMRIGMELWETQAGAWVAVSRSEPAQREGFADTRVVVIEKGNEMAMQDAAMELWEWSNRARSMVRDGLRWRLDRTVA